MAHDFFSSTSPPSCITVLHEYLATSSCPIHLPQHGEAGPRLPTATCSGTCWGTRRRGAGGRQPAACHGCSTTKLGGFLFPNNDRTLERAAQRLHTAEGRAAALPGSAQQLIVAAAQRGEAQRRPGSPQALGEMCPTSAENRQRGSQAATQPRVLLPTCTPTSSGLSQEHQRIPADPPAQSPRMGT